MRGFEGRRCYRSRGARLKVTRGSVQHGVQLVGQGVKHGADVIQNVLGGGAGRAAAGEGAGQSRDWAVVGRGCACIPGRCQAPSVSSPGPSVRALRLGGAEVLELTCLSVAAARIPHRSDMGDFRALAPPVPVRVAPASGSVCSPVPCRHSQDPGKRS